jgi:hypothetical protein
MKPLVSEGALRAAFISIGGILVAVSAALIAIPGHPIPHWVLVVASAVGGVLGGKEALAQSGTIKINQLPLEWQERKTDPK